jgi:plastocyanin
MAVAMPRILFAVPFIAAAIAVPAVGSVPSTPPSGTVGMGHESFSSDTVNLHCGQTLTLTNNSRWIHIIGPGHDGHLVETAGVPMTARVQMQTNDVYKTAPWTKAGTYYLTCSVHPEMLLKVVVAGSC